jgi:hypothetical protein
MRKDGSSGKKEPRNVSTRSRTTLIPGKPIGRGGGRKRENETTSVSVKRRKTLDAYLSAHNGGPPVGVEIYRMPWGIPEKAPRPMRPLM